MKRPGSTFEISVATADALRTIGELVSTHLFSGAVVLLDGPLAAGKTTFVQGVARGLGVRGVVTSPTYAILHEYPEATIPLRHADLYRIESAGEWASLALDERVGIDGAWLIEWASRFPEAWPAERLEIRIEIHGDARLAYFAAFGLRHVRLLALLAGASKS